MPATGGASSVFELTLTRIKVEGTDGDVIFSDLMLDQYLADVNAFSFIWRQEERDMNFSDYLTFYQSHLSKEVTISIQDSLVFKGIVCAINCHNRDKLGVSYQISGKGLFARLDEVPECNSFYKKTLSQIFNTVNNGQGTSLKLSPKTSDQLFYTVQYNQTRFEFMRMMAARYGEWLFYTGTDMVLGTPGTDVVNLKEGEDVYDLNISARLARSPQKNAGFDSYKGEIINGQQTASRASGLTSVCLQAGENAFGTSQAITHLSSAFTPDLLKELSTLGHQATAAGTVFLTGLTYNCQLKLGTRIQLQDLKNHSAGEYIVTELHHHCITPENYQNYFVAVPADAEVPPYTNPRLFPVCRPQPALVTSNEDKDGIDRIKVHFPWQPSGENTPWISVLTPHAGKGKGLRFLPEIGEEVMIGFVDNNAEKPYVMGAIHTEKHKSGNDYSNNNLKVLGTRTGRRLEINDDDGYVKLSDNYVDKKPINVIAFIRNDSKQFVTIQSQQDDQNYSAFQLNNSEKIGVVMVNGGDAVTQIILEGSGKTITIESKAKIKIKADTDIVLNANDIELKAANNLKMTGSGKVEIKGAQISVEADATMEVKGAQTQVEASAQLDLKSDGISSLSGSLVKIN